MSAILGNNRAESTAKQPEMLKKVSKNILIDLVFKNSPNKSKWGKLNENTSNVKGCFFSKVIQCSLNNLESAPSM